MVMPSIVRTQDTNIFNSYGNLSNDTKFKETLKELAHRYIEARISGSKPTNFEKGFWDNLMIRIHKSLRVNADAPFPANGICIPGQRKLFVTAKGTFHPCEKVSTAFCIGDARKGIELDKVRALIDAYVTTVSQKCCHCWAARFCRLCYARVRKGLWLDPGRWAQACDSERTLLDYGLRMYATIMEKNPSAFEFVQTLETY